MMIHWANGFWGLLSFSMQMAMVLVLGNTMASAGVFKKGLRSIASTVHTPSRAIMITAFVSAVCC